MHEPEEENPFASPQVPMEASTHPVKVPPGTHSLGGLWIGVTGSMFLGVFLLAISPGLGVLFALVAVPGLLAGWVRLERQFLATREQISGGRQLLKVVLIIMLFVPLLVVALVAFGVACTAASLVVQNMVPPPERPGIFWVLNWALPVGGAVGLIVYSLLFFVMLGEKPRGELVEDVPGMTNKEP